MKKTAYYFLKKTPCKGKTRAVFNYFFLFFFFGNFLVNAQSLDEKIYIIIDEFSKNKSIESLHQLTQKEKELKKQINSPKEKLAMVVLLCNKAYYLKSQNNQLLAITSYEEAWKLFAETKLSNYDIIEYCLKPLGNLYIKNKDYTNAENIIKHYIFLATQHKNIYQEVAGIINLSLLYQSIDKHTNVVTLINEFSKKNTANTVQKEKLQRIKLSSLLFLNEKKEGKNKNYEKIYKEFLRNNEKVSYYKLPIRQKAKKYLEEAQFLFLLGKEKEAVYKITETINLFLPNVKQIKNLKKENLYAEVLLIDAFDLLAEFSTNSVKKLKFYDFSFYISNLLETNITSQEAKIIHQNDNKKRSEKCIAILYELYQETLNVHYFKKALFYVNKFKSGVLTEKIHKNILLKKHPKDSLLLLENKLTVLQENLTNKLILAQTSTTNSLTINTLNVQLSQVSIQLKEIQKKVAKKYKTTTLNNNFLELVKEKLTTQNTTLVQYFYSKAAIYQFIIKKDTHQFNKINVTTNELIQYIRFFNDASRINNNIKEFTKSSFLLYKKLHIKELSKENFVILIPDGLLSFIPFETLLTKETTDVNFAKMPFLLKEKQLVYAINLGAFLQEETPSTYKNVLGVFPVFSGTSNELKYSLDEKKSIEKTITSTILLSKNATQKNVLKEANNFNILHFSTHAEGNKAIPFIKLFKTQLTLNSLYTLNLKANLAVLSACETGVGSLQKGEGVMSIARGFQYAGINNVLFSLWKINDKSTSVLMKFFYAKLKEHNSVSYANQQSKILYLKSKKIENSKKSPYYWGAFVYYGAFEKDQKNNFNAIIFILVLLGTILVFRFFFRKTLS